VDLQNDVFANGNPVYWGFTASTGGLTNNHEFCLVHPTVIQLNSPSNDVFICPGGSANLGVTVQSPGTIQWTPSTDLSSAVIQSPVASPSVNTTYTITSTDVCGEVTTETIDVNIIDPPTVSAGNNLEFCENTSITVTANASETGSFNWSTPDGSFVAATNINSVDVNAGGTYHVEFTSGVSGCTATDEVLISELPIPNFVPANPYFVCPDGSVQLSVGNTWDQVQWPDGSSSSQFEVTSPGNYIVVITDNNCSNSIGFQVEYPILTPPVLGPDVSICQGESAHLTAGISGNWSNGQSSVAIDVQSPGSYWLAIMDQGCELSDTIEVLMFLPPPLELGNDVVICAGDTAHFEVFAESVWPSGDLGFTYQTTEAGIVQVVASNGPCVVRDSALVEILDLPYVVISGDSVLCNNGQLFLGVNADHYSDLRWSTGDTAKIISLETAQRVSVIVTGICGSAVDHLDITVEDCDNAIYIPNAFTPNGDGINDVFIISAANVEQFQIDIFDRWGRSIFHSNELESYWLGGVMEGDYYVPDGIYHYRYVAIRKNLDVVEGSGFILLSR
jgi:gliding motility-associated-like protein